MQEALPNYSRLWWFTLAHFMWLINRRLFWLVQRWYYSDAVGYWRAKRQLAHWRVNMSISIHSTDQSEINWKRRKNVHPLIEAKYVSLVCADCGHCSFTCFANSRFESSLLLFHCVCGARALKLQTASQHLNKNQKKNNKMKIIPVEVQRLHGTATINEHPHTRNNSSLNVGWKQHVQSYNIPRAFLHLAQTSGHHTPKTITTNIIISNGQASQEKTATAAAKRANTSKLYRNQEKNESKTEHTLSQNEKKEEEENARRNGNQKIRDGWKR